MVRAGGHGVTAGPVLAFVARPEGQPDDADKGILNHAGRLAAMLGAPWAVATFAGAADDASASSGEEASGNASPDVSLLARYGAPEVWVIEPGPEAPDRPDVQAEALARAAAQVGARAILLAHTDLGSALAPVVAAELDRAGGAALLTEVVSAARHGEGVVFGRRALGAQALELRRWDGAVPLVTTVDPGVLSPVLLPTVRPTRPPVRSIRVAASERAARKRIVRRIPPDPQTVDVTEAEVIFCAGKGFDRESFEAFRELSRLLKASLGVTRPVYDLGWAGFERMIGQTGRTVAPRFYLGMGISGSMHHVGGIKDAKRIVCLNIDPKAPVFPNSDEGFVADIGEVVPLLLERVRTRLAAAEAEEGAP
ncbi:MAG: electron transfer flavoprotein subunit alpha/FixB family protein [Candidatus Dadabacteria bacterium]|nr:MAG: electron transfer flavoprotein subunit alpha/FixB family protein [Candidatus Dadabacteria bacterium]